MLPPPVKETHHLWFLFQFSPSRIHWFFPSSFYAWWEALTPESHLSLLLLLPPRWKINAEEPNPKQSVFCLLSSQRKENSLKTRRLPYGQGDWQILVVFSKSQTKRQLPAKPSPGEPALPGNERNRILIAIWIIVPASDLPTDVGNKSLLQI